MSRPTDASSQRARKREKTAHNQAGRQKLRQDVASGVINGRSNRDIGKKIKRTTRTVQRIKSEPATVILITKLMMPHRKRLEKCVPLALDAIERALKASRKDRADHPTRLRATEKLQEFLELAQGNKPVPPEGIVTWEQFVRLYNQRQAALMAKEAPVDAAAQPLSN